MTDSVSFRDAASAVQLVLTQGAAKKVLGRRQEAEYLEARLRSAVEKLAWFDRHPLALEAAREQARREAAQSPERKTA